MSGANLRVLLVYTGMIPSVEISALRPLMRLQQQGRIRLRHTPVYEASDAEHLLWCDVAVCCRCCMVNELSFLAKLRVLGIPYVYDLDDNFIRLAEMNLPNTEYLKWEGSRQTVHAFARDAFRTKVGSEQLRADLAPYTDRCVIQPYAFDFSLLSPRPMEAAHDRAVRIVYAGSLAHTGDLERIREALIRVLNREPGKVRISFYGAAIDGMEAFRDAVECIPYQHDYPAFLRDFSGRWFDIALAPLEDNLSNRSKTNNKYREYAACRVAGVYSDMPIYRDCVRDGENGVLAGDSVQAWEEAILRLADDAALRERIVETAWQDVRRNNTLDAAAERWETELLLPMAQASAALPQAERARTLRQTRREMRRWMYVCVAEGAIGFRQRMGVLYRYRLRLVYLDTKEALKTVLRFLGLFDSCKRLKDRLTLKKKGDTP